MSDKQEIVLDKSTRYPKTNEYVGNGFIKSNPIQTYEDKIRIFIKRFDNALVSCETENEAKLINSLKEKYLRYFDLSVDENLK